MNNVILIGRLTTDPEIRVTEGENKHTIARFNLAVDRRGSEAADFPSIQAWDKNAEFCEKYLHKGMKIALTGFIRTGAYKNKDGANVYTTDVIANNFEFCEKKGEAGSSIKSAVANGFIVVPEGIEEELPFA